MASINEDVKSNLRSAFESNTGVVGQALKDRREKANHEKEVAEQVGKIDEKTTKVEGDGRAIRKIEISSIQISENLQLINKWADAQVTTHDETLQAMGESKKDQPLAKKKDNLDIKVPKPEEDQSIFDSILSMFSNLAGKVKGKIPKGLKGEAPKGKGAFLRQAGSFLARNAGTIAKVGAGVGALTYAKGLNTNEQEELDKRRNLPPTITVPPTAEGAPSPAGTTQKIQTVDYSVTPKAPEGVQEPLSPTVVATPPSAPPAPPTPVQTPAYACTCPPPQTQKTTAPKLGPPPPESISTPVVELPQEGKGRSAYKGMAPQPVAVPTTAASGATTAAGPSVSPSPTPMAASMIAGKSGEAPPPATPSSLPSVVKLAAPDVTLDGIQSSFEKTVATMATAFKQQTGKTLLVTSGVRSNEKQKQLFDAKVAQLGGNVAAAKKLVAEPMAPLGQGKGSMHLKGLAIDINSKGDAGINMLAGTRDAPTGWLEKFGLTRPVPNEDWHIQLSGTPPTGDVGGVPGKDGNPVDPSTGKPLPVPKDPTTGQKLMDSSKTVAQIKQENSQPGTTTIVVRDTKEVTDYQRKKQSQGQTAATAGA